jgi:hypothetical protein
VILNVSVWTLWHGTELTGTGTCELLGDGIRVTLVDPSVELNVTFESLDGARFAGGHLTLYASHGDVIEMSDAAGLEEMAHVLRETARIVPEMTLALHGLGSARQMYRRSDHDRFFAPLLVARTAAQRASDPGNRLLALRAAAIGAELERVLHEFAVERFPSSPPDRRALEAELEDITAPIRTSLRRLEDAAQSAAGARDDTAFTAWRDWTAECRAMFSEADRCWLRAAPVLLTTPIQAPRPWWRARKWKTNS